MNPVQKGADVLPLQVARGLLREEPGGRRRGRGRAAGVRGDVQAAPNQGLCSLS